MPALENAVAHLRGVSIPEHFRDDETLKLQRPGNLGVA